MSTQLAVAATTHPAVLRTAFGILMVGIAVLYALPQFLRSRRGLVQGVSLAAVTNVLCSCLAWVFYAIYLRDIWVLLTSAAALPSLMATTAVLVRNGAARAGLWLTYSWAGVLTVSLVALYWTSTPAALLVGVAIVWYVGPAVGTAWSSSDVSGIAAGIWLISLLDAVVWAVYSLLAGLPSFLLYSLIAGCGSILVLLRLALPDKSSPTTPPKCRHNEQTNEPDGECRSRLGGRHNT